MRGVDKGNILAICAVVMCVALTVGMCFLLSGNGLIGAMFAEGVKGESVYFVCAGPYENIILARSSAELVAERGGAGYMLGAGSYELVYAAYASKRDAESVAGSIDGTYVKEINIKKSKLKWADKQMRTASVAALKYYEIAFETLRVCADKLNANELTIEDVKVKIRVLRQQIEDIKVAYGENCPDESKQEIVEIKVALITAIALVDNVDPSGGAAKAMSSMRYAAVQLALSRQALMEKI